MAPSKNQMCEFAVRDRIAAQLSEIGFVQTEKPIRWGRETLHYIDIYAQAFSGKCYLFELKRANRAATHGIGQALAYSVLCGDRVDELVVVLFGTPAEIAKYEPIVLKVVEGLKKMYTIDITVMSEFC